MRILHLFVVCVSFLAVSCDAEDFDYGITIDAGSSGSRVFVYRWLPRVSDSSDPPFSAPATNGSWALRVKGGLSSYADPKDAAASLKGLISFAANTCLALTTTPLNTIPLYLGATAGMRVLPVERQTAVFAAVRALLRASPFRFEDDWARIISGEEEGVFGWIAANFLMGTINNGSYGALDLGGASTQITFTPPLSTPIMAGYFPFRVHQDLFNLYTHSFLRFGINLIRERVDAVLLANSLALQASSDGDSVGSLADNPVLADPCGSIKFTHVCKNCGGMNVNITFVGSGNSSLCNSILYSLLKKDEECLQPSCSVAGVYQPSLSNVTFIAFSNFGFLPADSDISDTASLRVVSAYATRICGMDYTQLMRTYPMNNNETLPILCLLFTYTVSLLHDGYGFDLDNSRLVFASDVGGIELNWALGSILYQTNLMGWMIPFPVSNGYDKAWVNAVLGVMATSLVLFILLSAWLAHRHYRCCKHGRSRTRGSDVDDTLHDEINEQRSDTDPNNTAIGVDYGSDAQRGKGRRESS